VAHARILTYAGTRSEDLGRAPRISRLGRSAAFRGRSAARSSPKLRGHAFSLLIMTLTGDRGSRLRQTGPAPRHDHRARWGNPPEQRAQPPRRV